MTNYTICEKFNKGEKMEKIGKCFDTTLVL